MPEFFTVLSPAEALAKLWQHLPARPTAAPEMTPAADALGRVTGAPVLAPEPLPAFERSAMDGYAVRAADTYGASPNLPAYLSLIGECPMGRAPAFTLGPAQAALIHTGGMLPAGADAVVMLEVTQTSRPREIEVLRPVAPGENVIHRGDDIAAGAPMLPAGHWLRPQDIGGLTALGLTSVPVARRPRVALLATGDEIVPPEAKPALGQVRDVNSYTLASLVRQAGGDPVGRGIVGDDFAALAAAAEAALAGADALILSAGSSVSMRDMTAAVMDGLGKPGILVHGVAVKPGKPTILAVAAGKPIFGLPGNPVSALVVADLFVTPTLYRLQGCAAPPPRRSVRARLTHNVASAAGRVDYVPARIDYNSDRTGPETLPRAEPVFGKSNQIFTLVGADGMLVVPMDVTGLSAGAVVEVRLF
ncbi:MAG: molybdopterin molybdotransferase MoeA [Anaerolineales bacterium]|nr:molybdopterin molybdotransferase MoeA [Anaerolineales bacterium]